MPISEKYWLYIEITCNEMSQLWIICDIIEIFVVNFKQFKNVSFIGVTLLNYFYTYWYSIAKIKLCNAMEIIGVNLAKIYSIFALYCFDGWIVYIEKYGIVKNYLLIEYRKTDLFLIN